MSARRLPRPRLTYANVMSTVAAFIALGGTSYAVAKLPKNSVGTPQLQGGAVTAEKLAAGVAISGPHGPRGAEGPKGDRGPSDTILSVKTGLMLQLGAGTAPVQSISIPSGTWLLLATGSFVGGQEDFYRCMLPSDAGNVGAVSRPTTGSSASYALQSYLHVSTTTTVQLQCGHDGAMAQGQTPRIDSAQLLALRTDNLTLQ